MSRTEISIETIEAALDELVNLAYELEVTRPRPRKKSLGESAVWFHEIGEPDFSKAAELVENPTGAAIRQAINVLGQRLYKISSLEVMKSVCDRVADRDPNHSSWRVDVIDKAWEGVGEGEDRWWP